MIEITGNLWTFEADVRVITTNGTVKKNGECVMGRGCALEAKLRWPRFPAYLGQQLTECGNVVLDCGGWPGEDARIVTFPVKHHWHERADLDLIRRSALDLHHLSNLRSSVGWDTIVMPRPGCGNGGLRWEDVCPVIAPILDDRFHVITFDRKEG